MSDGGENQPAKAVEAQEQKSPVEEKSLQRMEALLKQSAMGIHILFQNHEIAEALKDGPKTSDFFDFQKMKRVQDVMTELITKASYYDKLAFIEKLDREAYHLLIRTYFHIVENTVRANTDRQH